MSDECPTPCPTCEIERAARHHDVLCLALKQGLIERRRELASNPEADCLSLAEEVELAREIADLAYPPPKAEGT